MKSEGTNNRLIRHVYGSGGLRKVQALALCIHKMRLELLCVWEFVTIFLVWRVSIQTKVSWLAMSA